MKTNIVLLSLINLIQYGPFLYWGAIQPLLITMRHEYKGDQPWGFLIGVFTLTIIAIVVGASLWAFFSLKRSNSGESALHSTLKAAALAPISMTLFIFIGMHLNFLLSGMGFLFAIPGVLLPF